MIARYALQRAVELRRGLGDPARLPDPDRAHRVRRDGLRAPCSGTRSAHGVPQYRDGGRRSIVGVAMLQPARRRRRARYERAAIIVVADLALQLLIVVLGLALLFEPDVLTDPLGFGGTPACEDVLFAFTLAIVGLQRARRLVRAGGRGRDRRRGLRRLIAVRVPAAVVPYVGIALVAVRASLPADRAGADASRRPMLGVVERLRRRRGCASRCATPWRSRRSRCSPSPATRRCSGSRGSATPSRSTARSRRWSGACTRRYNTPVVVIVLGALLALALVAPADLEFLAGIYAFGATLAFTLVHLSVVRAALPRARPRPAVQDAVQRPRRPAPSCRCRRVLGRRRVRGRLRVACWSSTTRRASSGWAGWCSGSRSTSCYRTVEGKPVFKRVTRAGRGAHAPGGRGRVRLDPRARPRHAARRRHHADGRPAGRRRERGRRARAAR